MDAGWCRHEGSFPSGVHTTCEVLIRQRKNREFAVTSNTATVGGGPSTTSPLTSQALDITNK